VNITLRYGRIGLPIEINDDLDVQVLRLNPSPPLQQQSRVLEDSFRSPIGTASLDKLAQGRESACIVIQRCHAPGA
jgi:hypothetical protein